MSDSDSSDSESELQKIKRRQANKRKRSTASDDEDDESSKRSTKQGSKRKNKKHRPNGKKVSKNKTKKHDSSKSEKKPKSKKSFSKQSDTDDSDSDDDDDSNKKKRGHVKQTEPEVNKDKQDNIPMIVDSDSTKRQEPSQEAMSLKMSDVHKTGTSEHGPVLPLVPRLVEPVVFKTSTSIESSFTPIALPAAQSSRSPTANILSSLRPSTMTTTIANNRGSTISPTHHHHVDKNSVINVDATQKTVNGIELLLPPPLPINMSKSPILVPPIIPPPESHVNVPTDHSQNQDSSTHAIASSSPMEHTLHDIPTTPVLSESTVTNMVIDDSNGTKSKNSKSKKSRDAETNRDVDVEMAKDKDKEKDRKKQDSDGDDEDDKNSDSENELDEDDGKKQKGKKKKSKNQRKKSSRRKHGQTSSSHHVTSKIYTAEELHEIAHADSPPPPDFVSNPPAFTHSLSKCSIHKIPDALPILGHRFYFEDKGDKTAPKDKIIYLGEEFTMPKGCKTPNVAKLRLKLKNKEDEAEFAKLYKKEEIRIFASTIKSDLKSIATMIQPCHIGDIEDGRGTYERQHQFIHYRGKCWHLNCTLVNHIDSRFRVKTLLRNTKNYEFYAICINRNRRINGRSRIYDDVYYRQNKIQTELPVYTISKVIAGRFLSYKKKVIKAEEARKKKKASKNATSYVPIPLPHIQTILTRDALEKQAASANKTSKNSSGNGNTNGNGNNKTSKHASSSENEQRGRGSSKEEVKDSTDSRKDKTKSSLDEMGTIPRLESQNPTLPLSSSSSSSGPGSSTTFSSLTLPLDIAPMTDSILGSSHPASISLTSISDSSGSGSGPKSNSSGITRSELASLTEAEQAALSLLSKSANTFAYLTAVDHKIQDGTDRAKTTSNMLIIRSRMETITRPMIQLIENASVQQPSIMAKLLSSFANVETTEQFKRLFQDENGWFSFCMIHALLTDHIALPVPDFSTYKARLTRMLQTGGASMD